MAAVNSKMDHELINKPNSNLQTTDIFKYYNYKTLVLLELYLYYSCNIRIILCIILVFVRIIHVLFVY